MLPPQSEVCSLSHKAWSHGTWSEARDSPQGSQSEPLRPHHFSNWGRLLWSLLSAMQDFHQAFSHDLISQLFVQKKSWGQTQPFRLLGNRISPQECWYLLRLVKMASAGFSSEMIKNWNKLQRSIFGETDLPGKVKTSWCKRNRDSQSMRMWENQVPEYLYSLWEY